MPQRTHYIIAYDISDDRQRTRLAKMLLDYGDRIQHSVFEADLSDREAATILTDAEPFIGPTDSLRLYALCATCEDRVRSLGRTGPCDTSDLLVV